MLSWNKCHTISIVLGFNQPTPEGEHPKLLNVATRQR